ncbi:zinc metallochaperone AztD [Leucobacter sp. gxy201]|uniref:zinc metallochaperone AztD n=1 Tax=Leucobacter sp. gxy201 TaxID=2957200 RepID=UPI003DA026D2
MKQHNRMGAAALALAGVSLLVTACAAGGTAPPDGEQSPAASETSGRVAVSYPGGIAVLDPQTLDVVGEFKTEEFTRLNAFGDGRTIAVTTSEGFQMLDTSAPALTDAMFKAETAGHVVIHGENTVLFDDGTGTTTIVPTAGFAGGYETVPKTMTYTADAPHHGVSIVLEDGSLLTTVGDETSRTGAKALHPHEDRWLEEAVNADCPGIHGEGAAAKETVVFGCENGALLFKDGSFTKLAAPDAYGRMGNAFVSETSPIVVGDYKNDPDAEGYLLNSVALIDTDAETLEVLSLPEEVRYTFRDLARGPGDLAYILSTDGQVHVLEPKTGKITNSFPVIEPWEGPAAWQDAHPAIKVNGNIAYITEPAAKRVHAVDLTTGKVTASAELDHTPNELAIAVG